MFNARLFLLPLILLLSAVFNALMVNGYIHIPYIKYAIFLLIPIVAWKSFFASHHKVLPRISIVSFILMFVLIYLYGPGVIGNSAVLTVLFMLLFLSAVISGLLWIFLDIVSASHVNES